MRLERKLTMIKIKTESLRKDRYVIHPRKEVKRPEMQYKHVDGEEIRDKTWINPAANHEDTINIADDDLPF